ncbi:NB-ARC domain-containing protein [Streptomyces sp. NPDC002922]|uniref:NB-ARC domain-containing protein n=1 Tax=Streptomyces sp. NPDC002922 TaxID=3154439 RepID=UPI0033BDAB3C
MRTLEAMLSAGDSAHLCRIEGPEQNSTSLEDREVVDFDIIDSSGNCLVAAQVKSGSPGRTTSAHNSFSVLTRLVRSGASERYELITNVVPDQQCYALMEALKKHEALGDLKDELETVLRRSDKSLSLLQSMSTEELRRLKRARVVFDARTDSEVRSDLYQCSRTYRNRHNAAIGEKSAGLLVGYLLSEVQSRAASDTSGWLISDFRRECLVEDETLFRALGRQDWGTVYGPVAPVPDVDRPSLLEGIESAFPDTTQSNMVRTCALTGLSGIGKSSLASAYLAKNAFKYDFILWIEAGSQESLAMSFRKVDMHLSCAANEGMTIDDVPLLRERVHSLLAVLPGRWLMVFDDAAAREVDAWLPTLGGGDVLITSIDSAAWGRSDSKLTVSSMALNEATSLIRNRMRLSSVEAQRFDRQIHSLALALECWPLALELSCGYIVSCEMSIADVGEYLDSLKKRALGDSFSVPRGYPRTLVAAIHLSMHHVSELARREGQGLRNALLQIVGVCCFFSSVRIPIHLATVSALVHPDEVETDSGSIVFDEHGSELPVREVIRLLTRVSFARYDAPLDLLNERSDPKANETITLNSVVQEILRSIYSVESPLPDLLSHAAFHTERWIREALDHGIGLRAHEISIHARELVQHVISLNIRTNYTAHLLGNLASFYNSRGNDRLAFDFLKMELEWLEGIADANEVLAIQTRIALAAILLNSPDLERHSEDSPTQHLTPVLEYVRRLARENDHSAAFLAAECAFTLQYSIMDGRPSSDLSELADDFSELVRQLPETPASRSITVTFEVAKLISERRSSDAIPLAREVLDVWEGIVTAPVVELRRLLVEALVHDERWEQASKEFKALAPLLGKHSLYHHSALHALHNVGLYCAMHWGVFGTSEALSLLAEITSAVDLEHLLGGIHKQSERLRYLLLEALAAYSEAGSEAFEQRLHGADLNALDSGEASDVAWVLAAGSVVGRVRHKPSEATEASSRRVFDQSQLMRAASDTEARCWLITASEFDSMLAVLGKERGDFNWPEFLDGVPVAIVEPRYMLGSKHNVTGETAEIQVVGICAAGFHDARSGRPMFVASPGWRLEVNSDEVLLLDGHGGIWAVAREKPSEQWANAASVYGKVRILYGFGFDLYLRDGEDGSRPITDFTEAAQRGFLCTALVGWGGLRVVPPHVKQGRGRSRTQKKRPKRRK